MCTGSTFFGFPLICIVLPEVLDSIFCIQCFGSGLDPGSVRSVDPYPYPASESGSRRAKMTHKVEKIRNFMFEVLDVLF